MRERRRKSEGLKLVAAGVFACGLAAGRGGREGGRERQGCARNPQGQAMTRATPRRGKAAIGKYGCGTCHTIPGVAGASALVGPNLEQAASRMYVAGVLPNTPDNMIRWIQHPRDVDPLTAMPNLGVTDQDARDIAGYLYTLK